MKLFSSLVCVFCFLFSTVVKADSVSALINAYAASRELPIIDAAREFVYANSDHGDGLWYQTYGNDNAYVLESLYRTASGDTTATRPQLLCGNRAEAMQAILGDLGIRSRTIYVFSKYSGALMGHVYLEVMNPTTGSWEIQDPDYNVAYEYEDGRRLGAAALIAGADFSRIYPINATSRGWGAGDVKNLLDGQFYDVAFSPTEGMLYYNKQASDTGLVASVEAYILENHSEVDYIPAQLGQYMMRLAVIGI
jgi:hypothetical protein